MKSMLLRAGVAALALSATSANATGLLDKYTVGFTKAISTAEASAVAYNWDTRRLLVTNDEEEDDGTNIWGEYDLDGNLTSTVTISGCLSLGSQQCDPEGLAYVGNGKYAAGLERYQDIALLSEISRIGANSTLTAFNEAPTISVGPDDAGNNGLEGVAYERATGDFITVRERRLETVFSITDVDFANETASVATLFEAEPLNLDRLSDIAVLSNGRLAGTAFGDNLLILSGRSDLLVEVTRMGELVSSYDLSPLNVPGNFEGVTLDEWGNIFLVSDDGDGANQSFLVKLNLTGAVPEPSTWAMMIGGLGLVGGAMRRKKATLATA